MSKTWLILLIVGVVLVGLFMAVAVAVFLFFPQIRDAMTEPQGPVLIYEVDPDSLAAGQSVDMNAMLQAIDRRLNPGWSNLARIKRLDNQRIEIAVRKKGEAERQRVEALLTHCGMLEFRILANRRDNKDLIKQALADPSKTKFRDKNGMVEAWWVPIKAGQARGLDGSADVALRQTTRAGRQITEVLVLNDDFNITAAYLTRAAASVDNEGRPCIDFAFNHEGGQRFGALTNSHLPDKLGTFSYKLAIILDDEVYSAPSIRGAIYESGQITGSFTASEVDEVARVLNAGTLPAKIRPVGTRQEK
jgi:preprotein translocase subunit SecD